ncbi:MAG: n2B [Rickettsiaceae bacterium]|jgi:cell division protein ZapE|nr:n2B [Rickettsiaceae bacterium]
MLDHSDKDNIILDDRQEALLEVFNKYAKELNSSSLLKKVSTIFRRDKNFAGLYIYGGVGRGKTMLAKSFYDSLQVSKTLEHFQIFMKTIHERLHILRKQERPNNNLVKIIAQEYAKKYKLIILDEFEVKDIADAMTLARLIPELQAMGVFIVITTNIQPQELYKDGIQRDSFLPFITYLEQYFEIFHLDSQQDYRQTKSLSLEERILYPASHETNKQIQNYIENLTKNNFETKTITVFGRNLKFAKCHRNILVTDFVEMFEEERSQADYIEICKNFDLIIIEKIRAIVADDKNTALRFINFLDQAYLTRVIIIAQLEHTPENILQIKSGLKEVTRALSRLREMNSDEYMERSKFKERLNG